MAAADEFPEAKFRAAIAAWWRQEQVEAAELAAGAPQPKRPVSVLTPIIEIDSHRATIGLLAAEDAVGFRIPPRLVKMGGYASIEEMADHLVAELKKIFIKKQEFTHA